MRMCACLRGSVVASTNAFCLFDPSQDWNDEDMEDEHDDAAFAIDGVDVDNGEDAKATDPPREWTPAGTARDGE